jgi:geranylgeranyl diphosphate synthase, type II
MHSVESLHQLYEDWRQKHPFEGPVPSLYAPADYLLNLGGKRMRPVLLLLAHQAYSTDPELALPAAHAIELFHHFTLMHDDIMDDSPLRRGKPTAHMTFGVPPAILSGDWLLIQAYELLAAYPPILAHTLMQLFNKTAREVCEGQQLDMDFENQKEVTEEEYLTMIRNKTAVLLAAALKMGGLLGEASEEDLELLYQAGIELGIAFQIMDDYLDAYGDQSGKIKGGDIRQNKKTILFIHARNHAGPDEKRTLEDLYAGTDPQKVANVLQLFDQAGTPAYVLELARLHGQHALDALHALAPSGDVKKPMKNLFESLLIREN